MLPAQFGRYRILEKVGEGGMGVVYRAEDTLMARRIALKVPQFTSSDSPQIIERFYREARIAAAINHPNLCAIYDVGQIDGIHYLTMPFLEGTLLSHLIDSARSWPLAEACGLVGKLALALDAMHQRGLIHRDIKPANILVQPDGEPVLMDFGLARSYQHESRGLTALGAAVGTPAYMAPEQVIGDPSALGPGTDIYSLGVLLYELLTGEPPFLGPLAALYGQILYTIPHPPSTRRPDLPPRADGPCLKALAKRIEDRYASMAEFAATLKDFSDRAGSVPPTVVSPSRAAREPGDPDVQRMLCPVCGKRLRLPATHQGKRVKCPQCQTALGAIGDVPPVRTEVVPTQVQPAPTFSAIDEAMPVVEVSVRKRRSPRRERRERPWTAALVLAGAGAVVLLVLLGVVAFLLTRSRADTTSVTQDETPPLTVKQDKPPKQVQPPAINPLPEPQRPVIQPGPRVAALPVAAGNSPLDQLDPQKIPAPDRKRDLKELVAVLKGHTSEVWACVFTPDGKTLITSGKDTTVRFWDLTGAEPHVKMVLREHTKPVGARRSRATATCWQRRAMTTKPSYGTCPARSRSCVGVCRQRVSFSRRWRSLRMAIRWPLAGTPVVGSRRLLSTVGLDSRCPSNPSYAAIRIS
jgi:serine/threonine protein kinase